MVNYPSPVPRPPSPLLLEYADMSDESPVLPTSRIARWLTFGAFILLAVALYFREGRRVAPLTATPPAPPVPPASTGPTPPAPGEPTP